MLTCLVCRFKRLLVVRKDVLGRFLVLHEALGLLKDFHLHDLELKELLLRDQGLGYLHGRRSLPLKTPLLFLTVCLARV